MCHRDSSWKRVFDGSALFSLALCANRSFSSSTCCFAAQAQCFGRLRVLVAVPVGVAIQAGRFEVSCLAARDSVYAGAVFVGPVVQSARFGEIILAPQSRASFGCVS